MLTELGRKSLAEAQSILDELADWMLGDLSDAEYAELRGVGRALDARVSELLRTLRNTDKPLAKLRAGPTSADLSNARLPRA